MRLAFCVPLLAWALLPARLLTAQATDSGSSAADSSTATGLAGLSADGARAITAADVRRHVAALAHDSTCVRATPSPELTRAARYVAAQFKALGLASGKRLDAAASAIHGFDFGEDSTDAWTQRYPVPGTLRVVPGLGASLTLYTRIMQRGRRVVNEQGRSRITISLPMPGDVRFASDTVPRGGTGTDETNPTELLSGRQTAASVRRAALQGRFVLYVPPTETDIASQRAVIDALRATSNVITVADEDSATFAARSAAAIAPPPVARNYPANHEIHWAVYVRPGAVRRWVGAAGFDLAQLWADTVPRVHAVPALAAELAVEATRAVNAPTGVNVAAVVPGTDTAEANNYVVISAPLERAGCGVFGAPSSVVGLLALAQAFSQPGARPRRPLVFVATSGAHARGSWGADYFAGTIGEQAWVVLSLTLGAFDGASNGAAGDSLMVAGLSDFEFATPPDWVAAQHQELGMRLVDGGPVTSAPAEHLTFVQRAIPSLHVRGVGTTAPVGADVEGTVRALHLLYYVTQELVNAPHLPRWTAAARARVRLVLEQEGGSP